MGEVRPAGEGKRNGVRWLVAYCVAALLVVKAVSAYVTWEEEREASRICMQRGGHLVTHDDRPTECVVQ